MVFILRKNLGIIIILIVAKKNLSRFTVFFWKFDLLPSSTKEKLGDVFMITREIYVVDIIEC